MTYLDNYPDVIILKSQIKALKDQIIQVRKQDKKEIATSGALNPLFQQLRSSYSRDSTQLAALKTRLKATENLLNDEKARAIQINTVSAVLAQLTRDYDVNKDLYQKLLRQRETARVSMNIDIANQGMTLKIQEQADLPSRPVGLRLAHFAILGLILGIIVPLGIMYLLVLFDGKVRYKYQFQNIIQAPVLGHVSVYQNTAIKKDTQLWIIISCVVVAIVLALYGYVAWLRLFS